MMAAIGYIFTYVAVYLLGWEMGNKAKRGSNDG